MATRSDTDRALGIGALVLGILILIGMVGFSEFVHVIGVLLVIVGVLILVNAVKGSQGMGVLFLVLGIVLLVGFLPGVPGPLLRVLDIIVGVVLVVYGILKLK